MIENDSNTFAGMLHLEWRPFCHPTLLGKHNSFALKTIRKLIQIPIKRVQSAQISLLIFIPAPSNLNMNILKIALYEEKKNNMRRKVF